MLKMNVARSSGLVARAACVTLLALCAGGAYAQSATDAAAAPAPESATAAADAIPVAPLRSDQAPAKGKEAATELDSVEVTGTRIRRVDLETASPVFVLDRKNIEQSGVATLGELLQQMPTIAGAATNPQVNNGGGTGASTVSLRGLGEDRTLLLLNGRRLLTNDVNAIPVNMIERVEVLKDGASAIYGSDAIGGVVNFITRKNFNGAEASFTRGVSSRHDGQLGSSNLTLGSTTDKTSMVFGLNYDERKPVISTSRDFSKVPYGLYDGQLFNNGSPTGPSGRYRNIDRTAAQNGGADLSDPACGSGTTVTLTQKTPGSGSGPAATPATALSGYRCFRPGSVGPNNDLYNFQPFNFDVTPQTRFGGFFEGSQQLGGVDVLKLDDIQFFGEALFNRTRSHFHLAPLPLSSGLAGVKASQNSYYNPFGSDVTFNLRLLGLGARDTEFTTDRLQFTTGFKGTFFEGYNWDTFVTFGHERQQNSLAGDLYVPALAAAIGPSFKDTDGVVKCGQTGAVIDGCIPINVFGIPDPASLTPISPVDSSENKATFFDFAFNITGDILTLPAGPLGFATGLEYRRNKQDTQASFLAQCCLAQGSSSGDTGSLASHEIYLEFAVPVLRDLPFAQSLNLSLGLRTSGYDKATVGRATTGKIGVDYRPFDQLLLRGNYARVFRAPTINELAGGSVTDAPLFIDPCNKINVPFGQNANIDAACGDPNNGGMPRDGSFVQTVAQPDGGVTITSNPNVKPEKGYVETLGFVYSPDFYRPLTIEMDYFQAQLNDEIVGGIGFTNILNQCFQIGLNCDKFDRNPNTHDVFSGTDTSDNSGVYTTSGLDTGIRLNFGSTPYGRINFNVDLTYLIKSDDERISGVAASTVHNAGRFLDSAAGGNGNYPRWRGLTSLTWGMNEMSAGLHTRYIGGVTERTFDFKNGTLDRKIESQFINDLFAGYNLSRFHTNFQVGIDNVLDKVAPLILSGFNGTTDGRTYDVVGRFYYGRVQFSF